MINFRIFGFGGAALSILHALFLNKFDQDYLYFFDTDAETISESPLKNKFEIGERITSGRGTDAMPNTGKQVFDDDIEIFQRLTKPDCIYVILGAFGGGTFSGIVPKIIELLHTKSRKFVIVGTMPFNFEDRKRISNAVESISEINSFTDKLILIKLDDLAKQASKFTLAESFRNADNIILEVTKEILFGTSNSASLMNKHFMQSLEGHILYVKEFIKENEYLISLASSKVIVADTNLELLKALTIDPQFVFRISPRKFEELLEYIYRLSGNKTKLTKTSRDNGADLLVWTPPPVLGNKFLTVVQAKRYNNAKKVGSREIRELIGTQMYFSADKAQMVTTSDFTKPAVDTAKSKKIDLLKFYELNDTIKKIISNS